MELCSQAFLEFPEPLPFYQQLRNFCRLLQVACARAARLVATLKGVTCFHCQVWGTPISARGWGEKERTLVTEQQRNGRAGASAWPNKIATNIQLVYYKLYIYTLIDTIISSNACANRSLDTLPRRCAHACRLQSPYGWFFAILTVLTGRQQCWPRFCGMWTFGVSASDCSA